MSRSPSGVTQTLYYALSLVLVKGSSLLFLPVVTHHLTPTEYGALDVILAFANISTILLGFALAMLFYMIYLMLKGVNIVSKFLGTL